MTTAETSENGQEAASGRQAKIVALVVAVSFFMQILDGTIVTTSLPQMAASFGVQPVSMSIGITVYMLTMAAFIPLSGWLGDRFGARRIFLMSIAVFTGASLFCGLSGSLAEFVLWRAVGGAGSALMTPVGRIIVLKNARKSELVQAIALITAGADGAGDRPGARWLYHHLCQLALELPDQHPDRHSRHGAGAALRAGAARDQSRSSGFLGFILSAAGLTFLLAALELSVKWDGGLLPIISMLAAGIVLSVMATRHFLAVDNPLLNLSAFRIQTFSMSTLSAGTACRMAINATPFLLPLLFQLGFGLSSIAAGTYLLVYFLGNFSMKAVTTPLLRFFGFRNVLGVNGLIAALSIVACGFLSPAMPPFFIHALLFLAGLSRSMEFTALNTLAFADIGPAQRSSASTLSSMLQQVSMLLGVAVAAAVLNIASALRGADNPVLADFRWAFIVVGVIGVVSSLRFLQLPAEAGAEVSGHRKFQKS